MKTWTEVHSARVAKSTTTAGNSNASRLIRDSGFRTSVSSRVRYVPRFYMVFSPARTVSKQVTGMSARQAHQAETDVAQSQNTVVIFTS